MAAAAWKLAAQRAVAQERELKKQQLAVVLEPEHEATTLIIKEPKEPFKKRLLKFYKKFGLKHLALHFAMAVYAFIGAGIFQLCEADNELKERQALMAKLNQSAHLFAINLTQKLNNANHLRTFSYDILAEITELIKKYQKDAGLYPPPNPQWDFWGAMFFAGTVFTTIGYGNVAPKTPIGRLATILYALLGIPLLLALLSDSGKVLSKLLKRSWTKLRRFIVGVLQKYQSHHYLRPILTRLKSLPNEKVQDLEYNFPIPLALIAIVVWILFAAAMFLLWERWDYFTSIYFFFVSLTTIGLGDIVPERPNLMIINFWLVLVGLSLISLLINLMQTKLEVLTEEATDVLEEQLFDEDVQSSDSESGAECKVQATLGVIQAWKKQAGAYSKRRRGVQTEDSYVRDLKTALRRKFPDQPILYAFYNSPRHVPYSSDDLSVLFDVDKYWNIKSVEK